MSSQVSAAFPGFLLCRVVSSFILMSLVFTFAKMKGNCLQRFSCVLSALSWFRQLLCECWPLVSLGFPQLFLEKGTSTPTAVLKGTCTPTAVLKGTSTPTAVLKSTSTPTAVLKGTSTPTAVLKGTGTPHCSS